MDQKQQEELIAKYLSGNIGLQEREALLSWAEEHDDNKKFFDEMIQLWGSVEEEATDFDVNMGQAWQKIASQTSPVEKVTHPQEAVIKPLLGRKMFLRIAAAVLFLVVATYLWPNDSELIFLQTAANESTQVDLPDGTKIWLNQNSQLSYSIPFNKRNVKLEGEAFFEVERMEDSPFTITGGETKTRVLGTSFNVRAYSNEDKVMVTVTSGKVQFELDKESGKGVILEKGDAGVFAKEIKQVEKVVADDINVLSWKTKSLNFEETPLKEVCAAMERHFGIKIEIKNPALELCSFNGVYGQPNVDDLVETLKFSMNVNIERQNNVYVVSGEGCEKEN